MSDRHDFFEDLVYQTVDYRRYTQESPVMPDVWIQYGMHPGQQQDLLLVPNWHYTTADLANALREGLAAEAADEGIATSMKAFRVAHSKASPHRPAAVAHNQNVVVATLWFDQLVRVLLPLSDWWKSRIAGVTSRTDEDRLAAIGSPELVAFLSEEWSESEMDGNDLVGADIIWLARVAGLLTHLSTRAGRTRIGKAEEEAGKVDQLRKILGEHGKLARDLAKLLGGIRTLHSDDAVPLYSVNLNRETAESLHDSLGAVKGDATRRVFSVGGRGIRWAVIDSGIDAQHPAFRVRDGDGVPKPQAFERKRSRSRGGGGERFRNQTRVLATFDFTHIRQLLGLEPDAVDDLSDEWVEWFPLLGEEHWRDELKALLKHQQTRHIVDWERLEPFLQIEHTPAQYRPPVNRHGTHVAGIIGADWRSADADHGLPGAPGRSDMSGVAPDVELYDLRVLDDQGRGNEFAIMSALQFVRDLNNRKDFVAVHGVNLSFSIQHDVANYACGRTPVCDEATRMVGSGIIVVAAAGNAGRARYVTPSGSFDDGFRTVSITDPGNAEAVITVGATHRRDPHTYGVSYFSSRGPTGDGRSKPDLVAPGEKIRSTVPEGGDARLDGTSMAAPHVSGAAALLLSRHREFVGEPERVKQILLDSATDLGRERYFQGAGMLDVLRALQST